jgi:hypothetical protein
VVVLVPVVPLVDLLSEVEVSEVEVSLVPPPPPVAAVEVGGGTLVEDVVLVEPKVTVVVAVLITFIVSFKAMATGVLLSDV